MSVAPLLAVRGLAKHFPVTRGIVLQRSIGAVKAVETVADRVDRLEAEYNAARAELAAKAGMSLA